MMDEMENEPLISDHKCDVENTISCSSKAAIMEASEEGDLELNIGKEDKDLFANKKRRGTSLICMDAFLLILNFIQLNAFVLTMALRWPWPSTYVQLANFEFLINLDFWEFIKYHGSHSYKETRGYFTDTEKIGLKYWQYLIAWAIVLVVLFLSYAIAYICLSYRKKLHYLFQVANLQKFFIVLGHMTFLPLGILIGRVFHCTDDGVMDVDNDIQCFSQTHFIYKGVTIPVILFIFVVFPMILIYRTKRQVVSTTSSTHEAYLQLKETEYMHGLDVIYLIGSFYIFSSFRRSGQHARASLIFMGLLTSIVFAGCFLHVFLEALLMFLIFGISLLMTIIIRPYRVTSFNVYSSISYLCLAVNCMIGSLKTTFDPYSTQSAWLTPEYLYCELMITNLFHGILTVFFVIYLILRQNGRMKQCCVEPLWPTMNSDSVDKIDADTQKYIRAIIRGRIFNDKILKMNPIFTPVHELSRQIQVINAYCREAEYTRNLIHDTLLDLLNEMIETHRRLSSRSLLAATNEKSAKLATLELIKIMPEFAHRLAQREYDTILMSPIKKRLLFKMFCVSAFWNGRRNESKRKDDILNGLQNAQIDPKTYTSQLKNYHKKIYPEHVKISPEYRPASSLSFSSVDLDKDPKLLEIDEWIARHPLSQNNSTVFSSKISTLDHNSQTNMKQLQERLNSTLPRPSPGTSKMSSQGIENEELRKSPLPGQIFIENETLDSTLPRSPSAISKMSSQVGIENEQLRNSPLPGQIFIENETGTRLDSALPRPSSANSEKSFHVGIENEALRHSPLPGQMFTENETDA